MKTLYERYDEITASEAFKQRMVRTLQSEVAETSDEKVVRMPAKRNNVVRMPMKKKTVAIMIAAAVLSVLTIGTAVAAAAGLFTKHDYDTVGSYLNFSKEDREESGKTVSDIENVIEATKPESVEYSITMLPEMKIVDSQKNNRFDFIREMMPEEYQELVKMGKEKEYDSVDRVLRDAGYVFKSGISGVDDVNAYRQELEQPIYSEENFGWIREIKPEIEEVLIDGNTWAFNIRLHTDHGLNFEALDGNTPAEKQCIYANCAGAFFTVDDSDQVDLSGYPSSHLLRRTVTEDGCTLNVECNIFDYEMSDYERAEFQKLGNIEQNGAVFPTEGKIQFTVFIDITDDKMENAISAAHDINDSYSLAPALLGRIRYTFTFDASAGKDTAKQIVHERPLSGSVVLTMIDDEGARYNEVVSLKNVVLEETLTYRSTGIYVQYTVKSAPDGWREKYAQQLLNPFAISVVCFPEGEEAGDGTLQSSFTGIPEDEYLGIIPVYPSDYETVRDTHYKVQLVIDRIASFNGQKADKNWVMEKAPNMSYYETYGYAKVMDNIGYEQQVIAEFDLPMP